MITRELDGDDVRHDGRADIGAGLALTPRIRKCANTILGRRKSDQRSLGIRRRVVPTKPNTPAHLTYGAAGSAVDSAWNMPVWNRNRRALATISTASR